MTGIAQNLESVRERIERAAVACGRSSAEVALIAVTKTFPVEIIEEAVAAGHLFFGENRVQEAEPKIRHFAARPELQWHLIGHLQSNKARPAAELFQAIHSIDSLRLAQKLSHAAVELDRRISVLVQVDLGEEETKFGTPRSAAPALVKDIVNLPGLQLNGLMTIPPFFEDGERTRPFFAELRKLRDRLEEETAGCLGQRHLSMGMSHDFEVAIAEGATMIRVGTAIFGERK